MVLLVICLTGYALALPFAQDNRGRRTVKRAQRTTNATINTPNTTPRPQQQRPASPNKPQPEDSLLVIDNEDESASNTSDTQAKPLTPIWHVQPRPLAKRHGPKTSRQHEVGH